MQDSVTMGPAPLRTTFVVMLVAVLGEPSSARAGQATCSNPGLPIGAAASSDLLPWRLTASLTTGVLPITTEEEDYDARLVLIETRFAAELALRSWLGVGIALPVRVVDVDVTDHDPTPTIHARDETIRGLGDPGLLVHGLREIGAYRLHARLGTSLPFGSIEEDPHLLGMIGQ
jgi:hypothetical protein